jgi:putative heme-binding domain-containing protein
LTALWTAALNGNVDAPALVGFRERYSAQVINLSTNEASDPRALPSLGLAVLFGHHASRDRALRFVQDRSLSLEVRLALLRSALQVSPDSALGLVGRLLDGEGPESDTFQVELLGALEVVDSPQVGEEVLRGYTAMRPSIQPQAIELLCGRAGWAVALLDAVEAGQVPVSAVNLSQVRRMLQMKDRRLAVRVEKLWGQVRSHRNPDREEVIARMRGVLASTRGDAGSGRNVFQRVCSQCHMIYGSGHSVGPDLTDNCRGSLEQLLSNVLDPNQVIGRDYQAHLVVTTDGRVLTRLLVEDSPQRLILKTPGGKTVAIPREAI